MSGALIFDSQAWASKELSQAAAGLNSAQLDVENTQEEPDPSKPAAAPYDGGRTVVVVGAGPAGLLAAHLLARRHKCAVEVFDRRPHPGPIPMRPGDEDDDDRAFAVALNARGADAVVTAGLDVAAFTSVPGTDMSTVRDTVLARGDGLPRKEGDKGSTIRIPFDQPRVVGSRQAFVRALLHQVEEQQAAAADGGHITFHWGASFISADLVAQTATFELEEGGTLERRYALLVGADGYWSRVRRAAEKQDHSLRVTTSPPNRHYKVVRGLPAVPYLRLLADAAEGPQNGYGRLCIVQEAAASVKAARAPPSNLFISHPSEAKGVTVVLTMAHARWAQLEEAEAFHDFLQRGYPSLPDSWVEKMAQQLASKPLYETGMQVHASQLHAHAVVLLGDAAHAVSPATSNGMNSALEDASVLSRVLEQCGDDLATLPARYTTARLADVQGLLWLDSAMSALAGRGGDAAALKASVVARLLLHKASRGWVRPHALVLLKDGSLPYAEAAKQVQREAAMARVVTSVGKVAGVGGAAVAAVSAGMARFKTPAR